MVAGNTTDGATLILDNSGGTGIGPTSIYEGIGVPLVQQYNLDLQYEVAHDWVVDVGYVGSHGTHLYDWAHTINYADLAPGAPNGPLPSDKQDSRMILGSGAPGVPNSFVFNDVGNTNPATQVTTNTYYTGGAPGNVLGRVPYLGFATTGLSQTTTQGDSLYNSLQVGLKHQFSHGLLLQASYTWSKLMTNINSPEAGGGISAPGNVLSGGASSNDPLDFAQQYGLAAFNRPQRLVIAYSYDLPYHHTEGLNGKILGGWTVSGVTTIQDGEPFTVIDGNAGTIFGAGGFGGGGVRAELASPGKCNSYGVCQSAVALATSGSTESRVASLSSAGTCNASIGWVNLLAYGSCTGLFGSFAATGAPCIGGTVQGDCAGSGRRHGLREFFCRRTHGPRATQLGHLAHEAHEDHRTVEHGIPGGVLQRLESPAIQPAGQQRCGQHLWADSKQLGASAHHAVRLEVPLLGGGNVLTGPVLPVNGRDGAFVFRAARARNFTCARFLVMICASFRATRCVLVSSRLPFWVAARLFSAKGRRRALPPLPKRPRLLPLPPPIPRARRRS